MLERLGRFSSRVHYLWLAAGCLLLYCAWFTHVPLSEVDETRFSEATREMLESGDFLLPAFNYAPRYQKPILYYWVQAACVRIGGVNEVSARLPSALAAIVLVLLVYRFLAWVLPRRASPGMTLPARERGAAFAGAAMLATVPVVVVWARAAVTDMLLTLCISAALLAILVGDIQREGEAPAGRIRPWYLLAAAACGLAMLTKGPVGVAIPILTWMIYHLWGRSLAVEVRRFPWAAGVSLFLLVAAPWYVATYFRVGTDFLQQFFLTENVSRYLAVKEGHGAALHWLGYLIYLPISIVVLFPGSVFVLGTLRETMPGMNRRAVDPVTRRLERFSWSWIIAVLAFFSLSRTQLPSYIQSIAVPAAILFAVSLRRYEAGYPRQVWRRALEMGLLLVIGGAFIAGPIFGLRQGKIDGPLGSWPLPHPGAEIASAGILGAGLLFLGGMLYFGIRGRRLAMVAWSLAAWPVLLGVLLFGAAPLYLQGAYGPVMTLGTYLRNTSRGMPVLLYEDHFAEDLVYYARRRVEFRGKGDPEFTTDLRRLLGTSTTLLLITDTRGVQDIPPFLPRRVLFRQGDSVVLRITKLPVAIEPWRNLRK